MYNSMPFKFGMT